MKRPGRALRYANCWEDADLLLDRLGDLRDRRVLSIASGGENSLSLLSGDPAQLVVVDRNPAQLALFELKMAAMKLLEREEFLAFLGYSDSADRWRTYGRLRDRLGPAARACWDEQRAPLERGVIHTGRVARTLRLLARFVLPLVHGRACSRELMAPKSADRQARFYETVWDNRRWRAMARVLFGKPAIYLVSPERDFFKFHGGGGVAEYLLEKSRRHLSSVTAQENHMLHYLLFGSFGPHLPHFVRAENYDAIRARLAVVAMHEGVVETAFPAFGRFDAFNLSNIFEYTTPAAFRALAGSMAAGANPGARFAYWNVLVPRALSAARPDAFRNRLDTGRDPSIPDKGWHYSRFLLDERVDP
jgi:S-adenosylmethionine-diacylglycerol 3-amino-3-carboxypropyl transferase